ncbi:hypothetical protein ACFWA5_49600 [Streptomyces mirabilis]|uniref:hypothetical protein n=1 Tax=Streptomyces mirabilis TaxID=68239 RepID=UPI00365671A8
MGRANRRPGGQNEELLARYCCLAAAFDERGGIQQTPAWLMRDGADSSLDR